MNNLSLNRMAVRALVVILLSFPIVATAAEDYFVRPYVAGAYSPNDGSTYATAWNGFNAINWDSVANGDTLYVCGTHLGEIHAPDWSVNNLAVGKSGTAGFPIVIDGNCPGEPARGALFGLNGAVSPAEWSSVPDEPGMYTRVYSGCSGHFLLEQEAEFPLSASHPGTRQRWAKDDFADPMANRASWTPGSVDQTCGSGIIYYKPATGTPTKTVYLAGTTPITITNQSYITIRNLDIFSSMRQAVIDLHNADHIVIENNDIQWGSNNIQIWEDSDDGIIRNNRIHDSIASGIYFLTGGAGLDWNAQSNDGWLVQNNEVYNVSPQCEWCGIRSGDTGDIHSIAVQGGGNNHIWEFNHIHHSGGDGVGFYNFDRLAAGNPQRNNIIRYNFIHDVKDLNPLCLPSAPGERDGPDPGFPVKCQINYGIFLGSDGVVDPDTITGNIVHHNVLARIRGIALETKSTKPISGYTWRFLNNTIIGSGIGLEFWVYDATDPPYRLGGAEFRNNIIYSSTTQHLRAYLLLSFAEADTSGFGMSNNIYDPDGAGMFKFGHVVTYGNSVSSNFAGWTAPPPPPDGWAGMTDPDSLALTSGPLFADPTPLTPSGDFAWYGSPVIIPGAGNFQLTAASPAFLNPGASYVLSGSPSDLLADPNADILGNPLAGTRDRGAYELLYADLGITIADSPDPVLQGQTLTYTITVNNNGPITATGVNVTASPLTDCSLGTIMSGASVLCVRTVTAAAVGMLTQTVAVTGAEVDLNAANNSATVDTTVQAAVPDLLEATLTASVSGTNFLINDRVTNGGNGSASAFDIRYYLSTNATYEAADTPLCSRSVASLAAGASNPVSGTTQSSCAIPSTAAGSYNIIARVDDGAAVTESNEGNNVSAAPVSVTGKDLLPTAFTAVRVSGHATKVTTTDTVKNQGSVATGSFTIRYYLSTDTTYGAGDLALATTANGSTPCNRTRSSLAAGASSGPVNKTCYKPAGAQNGVAYYVIVVDDSANTQVEYNESNNTRATTGTLSW